ncbi:MAG: RnfABCDGE type electron transport complex subunit G [Bacteroidetes bacterium]|nr:RnfABCDGE type electron transport complex subunit G [Bacteroidota bacterium]MBL6962930.1 RnfABCDGE type electron transport complex subunit G [Bacteroidota bacterium]
MASKKESTFLTMTMTLFIVTVVAAFSLGSIYNLTKDKIKEAKERKVTDAIRKVLPEFDRLEKSTFVEEGELVQSIYKRDPVADTIILYKAFNEEEFIGTAVKSYTNMGYSGKFWIMLGIDATGKIYNTAVVEHFETPGLGDKMDESKSKFPLQFKGKDPRDFIIRVEKDGGDVDAITAATISSRAFCDAVNRAFEALSIEGGKEL